MATSPQHVKVTVTIRFTAGSSDILIRYASLAQLARASVL